MKPLTVEQLIEELRKMPWCTLKAAIASEMQQASRTIPATTLS